MTGIERGSFRSMAQDLNGTGIGGALFEALIHEWYSEHGEFDDLTIDSAEDLRDYIDRAVGHSALAGDVVFAVATRLGDGSIRALSKSFASRGEAEQELAVLLGDDYYRDQRPFVATSWKPQWFPTGCDDVAQTPALAALKGNP
jgi:hypothetical protein